MTSPKAIRFGLLLSFAFTAVLFLTHSAQAQWHGDSVMNTLICDAPSQQDFPASCSDGADGAIIVWHDLRAASAIYAQHINAKGFVTWAKNGIKVCSPKESNTMEYPSVAPDGNGGAYVVWRDTRYSQYGTSIFGQHILADGTLAYPDTGISVGVCTPLSGGATNQVITEDGFGNAFVAWEDNRTSSQTTDIYMNKMLPGSVMFGPSYSGTNCAVRRHYTDFTHYYVVFAVPAGTMHFPKSLANSPGCFIDFGGKKYKITAVDDDTTLRLTPIPSPTGENLGAWYVEGPRGIVVDSSKGKQTRPAIVKDGTGGCYLAWQSGASIPASIYAKRIDSLGNQLWNPTPGPGFLVYRGPTQQTNPSANAQNVSVSLDNGQLLLAWEVSNADANNGQDVFASRIRCSTPTDTLQEWGQAVGVTDGYLYDQTRPLIFSDDSVVSGVRGALVPFITELPGSANNTDVAMVRVLGDGGNKMPAYNAVPNMWSFETQPDQQGTSINGLKAVRIYDTTEAGGQRNSVLAAWRDSRYAGMGLNKDTVLFCQRMDRIGRKYYDSAGTSHIGTKNSKAIPVCSGPWQAKQITMTPRSDGAIIVWTDFRKSATDPSIYAQLVRADGSFTLPPDTSARGTTGPMAVTVSQTGSFDGSLCNNRCTSIRAIDTGAKHEGFDSIVTLSASNMHVTLPPFLPGADTVPFTICVSDTFQNGSAEMRLVDKAGNATVAGVTYCTIADVLAPQVFTDSLSNGWTLRFLDNRPWDRGLRGIDTSNSSNITFTPALSTLKAGSGTFTTVATATDPSKPAKVVFDARDTVGNVSITDSIAFAAAVGDVTPSFTEHPSLTVYPTPASSALTVHIEGIDRAAVSIVDALGRVVDRFLLEGTAEWHPQSLAPGVYILQAVSGNTVLTKRIVLEY